MYVYVGVFERVRVHACDSVNNMFPGVHVSLCMLPYAVHVYILRACIYTPCMYIYAVHVYIRTAL